MGVHYLKKQKMMDGAQWYGKVCTASIFIGMVVLFFFYEMPVLWADLLISLLMVIMAVTLVLYIRFYHGMEKEISEN